MRRLYYGLALFAVLAWIPGRAGGTVARAARSTRTLAAGPIALTVSNTGIYRLDGSYLQAHGINWNGEPAAGLAVLSQGRAVPRYVSTSGRLSRSSFVEFYAAATKSFYTSSSVYYLALDRSHALSADSINAHPGTAAGPVAYLASYTEARRTTYEPMGPGDGWFYTELEWTGPGPAASYTAHFALPGLVNHGTGDLKLDVWGVTYGLDAQHHLIASLNGHKVADLRFSGDISKSASASVPAGWLRSTKNALKFILRGDVHNQDKVDVIDVKTFAVSYPHALTAVSGSLSASLPADSHITVGGLRASQVTVWRLVHGLAQRLTDVNMRRRGASYTAAFAAGSAGTYLVADSRALLHPSAITAVHATGYLMSGSARLLVISAAPFIPVLGPLVAYHRSHGMSVKVADVADVYTRFDAGVFGPQAIRRYIRQAEAKLGTQYVLLVGADTYDYHDYERCTRKSCPANPNDTSYVPSFYARDDNFGRIPSDNMYVESKTGPTASIARIPAISAGQVRVVVRKTLSYLQSPPSHLTAVFAAGGEDPEFQQGSDALVKLLPSGYRVDHAYEGASGARSARKALLKAVDSGARLVDFVGHGNLEQWGQPPALFNVGDVPHLTNARNPALFLGWGCQTAYDVDPTDRALNARLLFAPHGGAVLSLGSTGLDLAQPQVELATSLFTEMFHDSAITTVGQALQVGEQKALHSDPSTVSPVQSYELYGDPTIPVQTLRGGH